VLKEKLRQLNYARVCLDTGPFLQLLSLVNSALTGMQLDNQLDYIAMTFLQGVARAIYTTVPKKRKGKKFVNVFLNGFFFFSTQGSKSKMEEYLADHLHDHPIWNDVRFWDQHFADVIQKGFKKKFHRLSIGSAISSGWSEEQLRFLTQFVASFAHESKRWSLDDAGVKG
jgi:hypothetical protein